MDKRKYLDLIVLLIISIFVVSVSAAVYYSIEMQTTATITYSKVRFDTGTDWSGLGSSSSLSSDKTYVFLNITAYPNATLTYDQPLVINNTDSTWHEVRFGHVSIDPNATASVSNFTFINFTLNGVGFDYTTTGDNWNAPTDMTYQNMTAGAVWDVKIETKAAAGATTDGSVTCTMVIALDVRE